MNSLETDLFRPDCESWLGYKPCSQQRAQSLANCNGCEYFAPAEITNEVTSLAYSPEVLYSAREVGIVEMGGLGSILRTSAVSLAIQDINPTVNISWFTHRRGAELLRYVPGVNAVDVETEDPQNAGNVESLDVLINFELNSEARTLSARARSVACFAINNYGKFQPASVEAENFQRLQIDDSYRKNNSKNMQQILLESIGLEDLNPKYHLSLPEQTLINGRQILEEAFGGRLPEQLIGLNIGTSEKGLLKRWNPGSFVNLTRSLAETYPESGIVLLSGPEDEMPRIQVISELSENMPLNARIMRHDLEIGDFMSIIGLMDAIVTADTFALHAARAQDIPVVVLAGPMPHTELEVLPTDSVIGPKLSCSPCYYRCVRQFIGECMDLINVDEVAESILHILTANRDKYLLSPAA